MGSDKNGKKEGIRQHGVYKRLKKITFTMQSMSGDYGLLCVRSRLGYVS